MRVHRIAVQRPDTIAVSVNAKNFALSGTEEYNWYWLVGEQQQQQQQQQQHRDRIEID
jgi:hypothetical protein